jgi:hypothetical protein
MGSIPSADIVAMLTTPFKNFTLNTQHDWSKPFG